MFLGATYSGINFEFLTNASTRVSHVDRFFLDVEITRRLFLMSLDLYSSEAVFENGVVVCYWKHL